MSVKKTRKPVNAAAAKAKKITFNLNEIGYTNLKGDRMPINFDQENFGESIYLFSRGISIERVAKSIHDTGIAECTKEDLDTITQVIEERTDYIPRIKQAIVDYINNLKTGG